MEKMLEDKDRIFKNLYNDLGSDLKSAKERGDWSNTKDICMKGRDWIINEIKNSQLRGRGGADLSMPKHRAYLHLAFLKQDMLEFYHQCRQARGNVLREFSATIHDDSKNPCVQSLLLLQTSNKPPSNLGGTSDLNE